MKMKRKWARGFTLFEVLIALAVFLIGLGVLSGVFLNVAHLNESSRNLSQALADAQTVLEAMRDTSTTGLGTVAATDWAAWALNNGLTSLPNETVTVSYADPTADPLEVAVQIDWVERVGPRSATVDTLMTQR